MTIPHELAKLPRCRADAAASTVMEWGHGDAMRIAGLPEDLPPDWQHQALAKLHELACTRRSYRVFLDTCVKCGACAEKCPYFIATGDPLNMPVARAELVRRVYRRYFTLRGRILGSWSDAEELTPHMLVKWFTYFHQCSECRRCARACPLGIDTAEITMLAREVLASCGVASRAIVETVARAHNTGNHLGISPEEWAVRNSALEREIRVRTGIEVKLPVDREGAEVLLLVPAADLVANVDTMVGYAVVFHHLGISWTTSSTCGDATNYGLFLDAANLRGINARVLDTARKLRVKVLMWGESGHGWRAGRLTSHLQAKGRTNPMSFLEIPYPYHVLQFAAAMIAKGALKVDKTANGEYAATIHDPCNLARVPPAEMTHAIREVVRYSCHDVREMPASITMANTICCGGGGGLLAPENRTLRMAAARPRAMAVARNGANFVAAPCEICKEQLTQAMGYWKTPAVLGGVMELLGRAVLGARGIEPFRLGSWSPLT
ncbi:MAG: (Fe-S)-binding protein [Thermodesulfobacteriota bacterium]